MTKGKGGSNDRYVVRHGTDWAVTKPNASRASSVHDTQAQAERAAKQIVGNLGGGEVRIQDARGHWRDSDTVSPGNDPRSSRDTKH